MYTKGLLQDGAVLNRAGEFVFEKNERISSPLP